MEELKNEVVETEVKEEVYELEPARDNDVNELMPVEEKSGLGFGAIILGAAAIGGVAIAATKLYKRHKRNKALKEELDESEAVADVTDDFCEEAIVEKETEVETAKETKDKKSK